MPALSKAQSRYLNMKFGHKWVVAHHFNNKTGSLPDHVQVKKKPHSQLAEYLARGK